MKMLTVIFCFALQLCLTSAAQAWSLTDSYRSFSGFDGECQVVAASDEENQQEKSDNNAPVEEEPDCE